MSDQVNGLLSSWLRERRIKMVSPYISGKVFDCGCGTGKLAILCKPDDYFGVDIDAESIRLARQDNPAYSFETAIPKNKKFDSIVLLAVIEHFKHPEEFFGQMRNMLNTGGKIILTTPHPWGEKVHYIGSKLRLFSSCANEEHEKLIDYNRMICISRSAKLEISFYKRFLLGANQLFILVPNRIS